MASSTRGSIGSLVYSTGHAQQGQMASVTSGASRSQARDRSGVDLEDGQEAVPFLGDGRFQVIVLLGALIARTAFVSHVESFKVSTGVMDHWCRQPAAYANMTANEWKELAVPIESDGSYSRCTVRDPPESLGTYGHVVPCTSWDYNLTLHGSNAVSQWNLVCHRGWLVHFAEFVYHAVNFVWLPVAGNAADSVGRQVVAQISVAALLIAGFASSLTDSFVLFVSLRTIVSSTSTSLLAVMFVLLYEVSAPKRRFLYWTVATSIPSVVVPILFTAANVYRLSLTSMHMVLMVPTSLLVFIFNTVDESPMWLLSIWKAKEAELVALRIADINGVSATDFREAFNDRLQRIQEAYHLEGDQRQRSILSPRLRIRTFLLLSIWSAMLFSVNITVTSSPRIGTSATWILNLAMAPMYATAFLSARLVGVKWTGVAATLTHSGAAAALALSYTKDATMFGTVLVVTARLAANMTIMVIYFLTSTLFPTTIRCTAVCVGIAAGKLAAGVALVSVRLLPRHRWDLALCAVSIVMALACVATHSLPERGARRPPRGVACIPLESAHEVSGKELRQLLRESLVDLPKGPQRQQRKRSTVRKDINPEQYAIRLSQHSSTSNIVP